MSSVTRDHAKAARPISRMPLSGRPIDDHAVRAKHTGGPCDAHSSKRPEGICGCRRHRHRRCVAPEPPSVSVDRSNLVAHGAPGGSRWARRRPTVASPRSRLATPQAYEAGQSCAPFAASADAATRPRTRAAIDMPIWRGEGDLDGVIRWRSSVAPFGVGHSLSADEQGDSTPTMAQARPTIRPHRSPTRARCRPILRASVFAGVACRRPAPWGRAGPSCPER